MITPEALDAIARDYHLQANAPDMAIERICQEVELDWMEQALQPSDHVLELGYGDGITFARFAARGRYTLVEGSPVLARVAQSLVEKFPRSVNVECSLFEGYLPSEPVDVVIASHVLEHVDDPVKMLKTMASWLSPGGRVIVVVPNADSIHRRIAVNIGLQEARTDLSQRDILVGHQRVYTVSSLKEDLARGGFQATSIRGFFLKPLANSQMLHLDEMVIRGLCEIGRELSPDLCANLAVVCTRDEK